MAFEAFSRRRAVFRVEPAQPVAAGTGLEVADPEGAFYHLRENLARYLQAD